MPLVNLKVLKAEVSVQPLRCWQGEEVVLQLQLQPPNQQAFATAV